MTGAQVVAQAVCLSETEARRLTDEVRADAQALWQKCWRLYEEGAHTALGYPSWGVYWKAEFEESIADPDRVRSMVSIMSTTGSRWTGLPSLKAFGVLFGGPPKGRDRVIERAVSTFRVIGSPAYPFEEDRIREIAAASYDRGHSAAGVARQLHAILASGDRTQALRRIDVPTTVIHGGADVLVRPAGGRATARAIPGARLRIFDGMGHDLPPQLWPVLTEEIATNAGRAGDRVEQAA